MGKSQLLYLSQADVVQVGITMADIIAVLETAFYEKGSGRVEMPPKPGIHPGPPDSFIHAMPAHIPALKSAGVKWVSGFPQNPSRGLPYINGLLILNDPQTGLPLSVMDCAWITAMRTGAATALSAKYLARADASVVGVLGCGVQGRTNVEALNVLFPLKQVMAYDVDRQRSDAYAREIKERFGLQVTVVGSPKEAVCGCDVVVTAGPILKTPHATIKAGWLDQGAFASLVDFDSYWDGRALNEAALFCTDDTAQLRYYQSVGYFKAIPAVHADLGELVVGSKAGRQDLRQRTMAANLGLAMDDMAVAPLVFQKACDCGVGTWLAL